MRTKKREKLNTQKRKEIPNYSISMINDEQNKKFSIKFEFKDTHIPRLCSKMIDYLNEKVFIKYNIQIDSAIIVMHDMSFKETKGTTTLKINVVQYVPHLYEEIYHDVYLFLENPEKFMA